MYRHVKVYVRHDIVHVYCFKQTCPFGSFASMLVFVSMHRCVCSLSGPMTIKKSRAWIGAQLMILCSINRKLKSADYKQIGVRFLCSV